MEEVFYWRRRGEKDWQEVEEFGGEGLVHDEEAQTFYARSGELAISRDRVNLRHFMGNERWAHLGDLRDY